MFQVYQGNSTGPTTTKTPVMRVISKLVVPFVDVVHCDSSTPLVNKLAVDKVFFYLKSVLRVSKQP